MLCLVVESSGSRRVSPGAAVALLRDDDAPDFGLADGGGVCGAGVDAEEGSCLAS
jgi:hypothetical protein